MAIVVQTYEKFDPPAKLGRRTAYVALITRYESFTGEFIKEDVEVLWDRTAIDVAAEIDSRASDIDSIKAERQVVRDTLTPFISERVER